MPRSEGPILTALATVVQMMRTYILFPLLQFLQIYCIDFIVRHLFQVITSHEFLYQIKCETMRSIVRAIAEDKYIMSKIGKELSLTRYPKFLHYPDVDQEHDILELISGGGCEPEHIQSHIDMQEDKEVKARFASTVSTEGSANCIYLLPPAMKLGCKIM